MTSCIESASAPGLKWVKSSYSGNNGNCVEMAALPDNCSALRDSKKPNCPALVFGCGQWSVFVRSLTVEEFN
ncbi:DUF397 domain-containing protein [Streptomyces scopuliridis]|uniref:DUF397 domain-containing protein n=1 Tax=Streptomyces scopuliridis TaxID=452529 RepID=UPI002DD8162B|nr:DUF397 domain-containing protein [Streptomyces scopuliridis]